MLSNGAVFLSTCHKWLIRNDFQNLYFSGKLPSSYICLHLSPIRSSMWNMKKQPPRSSWLFSWFFSLFLSFFFNFSETKLIRCAEISYLVIGFLRQRYALMMLYNNYANIQPRKYNNDATLYFLKTPVGLFLVLNQARKIWQSRTVITWCLGWLWSRN